MSNITLILYKNKYVGCIYTNKTNFWHDFELCQRITPGVDEIIFENGCGNLDGQRFKVNEANIKKIRKEI